MRGIFDDEGGDQAPPRVDWGDDQSETCLPDTQAADDSGVKAGAERRRRLLWGSVAVVSLAGAAAAGVALSTEPSGPAHLSSPTIEAPAASGPSAATGPARGREEAAPESQSTPAPGVDVVDELPEVPAPTSTDRLEGSWDPVQALDALAVLGDGVSAAITPYDRDFFGQEWLDVDRNGCDTRNDILRRDLEDLVVKDGTHGCVAESGHFVDPYTGRSLDFQRGSGNAGELHVDHIVALSDAWHKGAAGWGEDTRAQFANDPTNLVVTFGDVNMAKGGSDAGTWVPPQTSAHCAFAVQVVRVKDRYGLAVSGAEAATLRDILESCQGSYPELVGNP